MHKQPDANTLAAAVAAFDFRGRVVDAAPWGSGHINDTLRVILSDAGLHRPYIVQRMNTRIFRNVDQLMENIVRVTAHLRAKLAKMPGRHPGRETLTVIPTRDGRPYYRAENGDCWRSYLFIESAHTVDVITQPRQAYEAGRAFGAFQEMLADLPGPPLHETIPFFHDTPRRVAGLEKAIADDARGRLKDCGPEVEYALSLKPVAGAVVDALQDGRLPWRVTHNDTKINNVMLDDATGQGICVIDLDTVMPGSVLYDFGDEIRSGVGHFAENERDLSRVGVDLDVFENLAAGYLAAARGFLAPAEVDLLVFSGMLVTYTIGVRFLTDYLQGDVYFKTHRPGENLDRCRTQFELARSLRQNEAAMTSIVRRYAKRQGSGGTGVS